MDSADDQPLIVCVALTEGKLATLSQPHGAITTVGDSAHMAKCRVDRSAWAEVELVFSKCRAVLAGDQVSGDGGCQMEMAAHAEVTMG